MPMRNIEKLNSNQVFFVRDPETNKGARVFSVEQLNERIESGQITDSHIVQIAVSNEGLGSPRKEPKSDKPKIRTVSYT